MGAVKRGARPYSSALREEHAARTRGSVLDAARDLFIDQGYVATTIDQIAARAGVSRPTVFAAVGNKQELLATVRDVALAGDDQMQPIGRRAQMAAIRSEPDPYRAVALLAHLITEIDRRYAPIDDVLRGAAAAGEPDLRTLWEATERQRLKDARRISVVLAAKAPVRDGLDLAAITDELWLLMAPDSYLRLVHRRRWSVKRYEAWLTDRLVRLLTPAGQRGPGG